MLDNMDPLASVTNERLGKVVDDLKSEISNLNTLGRALVWRGALVKEQARLLLRFGVNDTTHTLN